MAVAALEDDTTVAEVDWRVDSMRMNEFYPVWMEMSRATEQTRLLGLMQTQEVTAKRPRFLGLVSTMLATEQTLRLLEWWMTMMIDGGSMLEQEPTMNEGLLGGRLIPWQIS